MEDYSHLSNYPYLKSFCCEQNIPVLPYSPYEYIVLQNIIVGGSLPAEVRDDYHLRRKNLEVCLEFANRHEVLDRQFINRLLSEQGKDFWSAVNELRVGLWFESQGLIFKSFEPPAINGNEKGDFLMQLKKNDEIFVEVKTIFGDKLHLEKRRLVSRLASYIREHVLPVESIDVFDYAQYPDENALINAIESEIRRLPPKRKRSRICVDGKGTKLLMTISPNASPVTEMTTGWSSIEDNLRSCLGLPVGNATPKLQVSKYDIPSIVIFCDFDRNINSSILMKVLYGESARWDGKTLSNKLSAVGVLIHELDALPKSANIYLCPTPSFTLDSAVFTDTKINWLQLKGEEVVRV